MKNNLLILAVVGVVIGIAAFFGGMKYDQTKIAGTRQVAQGQGGANRGNLQGRFGRGVRPVAGEIINSDDKSITVKMQDGSTRIVLLSSTTAISQAEPASKSDLKTGQRVAVFGMENSDGSVTAQNIQLNPQQMGFRNRGAQPTQGSQK